jgi:sugar diacid utilization regulator
VIDRPPDGGGGRPARPDPARGPRYHESVAAPFVDQRGEHEGGLTNSLQDVIESARREFACPVAIDDRDRRLLAHTEHAPDEVDEVRMLSILKRPLPQKAVDWIEGHGVRTSATPVVMAANEEIGMQARVCAPIRCQGRLLGFLWLMANDETTSGTGLERIAQYADEAGVVLYRDTLLRDLDRGREREFIRDILSNDDAVREHAMAQLVEFDLFVERGAVVAVVAPLPRPREGESHDSLRMGTDVAVTRVRRMLTPKHGLYLLRPDHALLIVSMTDPELRRRGRAEFGERLRSELARVFDRGEDRRRIVAIGGVSPRIEAVADSYGQALQAASVAATLTSFGDVVCWDDLGIYKMLAALPSEALSANTIPANLRVLIADPRHHTLVHTLERYLDCAGDAQRTAAQLYVHRTSLYHRLHRVEQLLDVDLKDGDDRLTLHLGLKFARLQGLTWEEGEEA